MDDHSTEGKKKVKKRGRSLATDQPTTRQPVKTGWVVQVTYEPDQERVEAGVREMLLHRQKGQQHAETGGTGGAVGTSEQSSSGEGRND